MWDIDLLLGEMIEMSRMLVRMLDMIMAAMEKGGVA